MTSQVMWWCLTLPPKTEGTKIAQHHLGFETKSVKTQNGHA